jgi:hypothetical protein
VASCDLHVAERDARIEGNHDERGPEHVGMHVAKSRPLTDRKHPVDRLSAELVLRRSAG